MRESFFGFNVALRGLYTAQKSLDVVNHNISNVNTPGYSRQQAIQSAARPVSLRDGTGMVGTGSDVLSVKRVRDEFLDYKYWSENTVLGEWDTKRALMSDMEASVNEPTDSGFNAIMNDFYGSLQELTKDPSSPAVRSLVKERGLTLTKYFNSLATHFEKLQQDMNYNINSKVQEVNSLGMQIQQLNKQIYTNELDGSMANDLRDQRTLMIDKLSRLANIDASEVVVGKLPDGREDKHMLITISGKALVDHTTMSKLILSQRATKLNPEEDVTGLYDISWEDGNSLKVKGGELKAYLDVRDGNDGDNGSPVCKGVPFYIKKLNQFVRTLAQSFNEGYIDGDNNGIIEHSEDTMGHVDGFGLDPDGDSPGTAPTGIRFFTAKGLGGNPMSTQDFLDSLNPLDDDPATTDIDESIAKGYKIITAKNFTISSDIIADYENFAASDNPDEVGNTVNLNLLLAQRHNLHVFAEATSEDFMKSMVSTLGIDSQQSLRMSKIQDVVTTQIETRRNADSGVSLDEEMSNMVKFQHAYNAAAKMISTMTEVYDTLLNTIR